MQTRETNWKLEKKIIKYFIKLEKVKNTKETAKKENQWHIGKPWDNHNQCVRKKSRDYKNEKKMIDIYTKKMIRNITRILFFLNERIAGAHMDTDYRAQLDAATWGLQSLMEWNSNSGQSGIPLRVSRIVENAEAELTVQGHWVVVLLWEWGGVRWGGTGRGAERQGSGGQAGLGQAICGLHTSLTPQLSDNFFEMLSSLVIIHFCLN